jgi:organic hydroperoxide reductase OsmC/OhrA
MAHEYRANVTWERGGATFTDNKFSRGHIWSFDGGITVPASSAPSSVPLPLSVAAAVDPEEALVAALSSCHMLFFLAFAMKKGFVVDRYADSALGEMSRNERGRFYISKVTLAPEIVFSGEKRPTPGELDELNHAAHEHCYIANSIRGEVVVQATMSFV